MFKVTIIDDQVKNQTINCSETESLLDSTNRQGIKIPYACKGGG